MADKRRRDRKPNRYLTKVFDADTGALMGRLVNVSTGGMMLITDRPYETGDRYSVRVVLPQIIHNQSDIDVEIEVRWCKKDANPDFYGVGFQFLNLCHDDLSIIENVFLNYNFVG
jgi:c-di-GMP-binding flagellar brake protein YcgR